MACVSVNKDFAACVSYALFCLKKQDLVLKPEQLAALEFIFQGKDVFVWFPTGFGVCYQALPFMFDHKLGRSTNRSVVLVVSPLVSLMVDQVNSLRSIGVGAAIMSIGQAGGQQARELLVDERDVEEGKLSLLFGAPEVIVGSERWR
jgi:superfamily II DNA helicase RecQ